MTARAQTDFVQTWPPHPASVAAARRCLQQCLRHWQLAALVDVGTVVISELATNAVRHAATDFTVTLSRMTDGILIRVNDGADGEPSPAVPTLDALAMGGRGMLLVDALSAGWGVVADGRGGKAVWALIRDD